jgi:hypothetical protein
LIRPYEAAVVETFRGYQAQQKDNSLPKPGRSALDAVKTFDQVLVGNDAIIYGYPVSLGLLTKSSMEPAACFLSRISGWRDRSLYPLAWEAAEFTTDGALDHARALGHGAADSCLLLWGGGRRCWCARSTAAPAVSYRAIVTEGRAIDPR